MPPYAILAALVVAFCWGGNFSASKIAMMDLPPFLTVLVRFVMVAALLAPLALRQKKWPAMRDMGFIAVTLIVMHFSLLFVALHMGLTITSVIVATQMGVPFSCIVSSIMFKDHMGPWRAAGLIVAFMGVLIVALTPNASEHWIAFMIATVASLSWSCANIYLKRMGPTSVIALLFWPSLFAIPMLTTLTLIFESGHVALLENASRECWLAIGYSTVFSSLVGYGLWNWLITKYPLSQVVPYSLCVPIAGIAGGVWIFHEPLTTQIILGATLTIVGVGIIALRRPKLAELGKDVT